MVKGRHDAVNYLGCESSTKFIPHRGGTKRSPYDLEIFFMHQWRSKNIIVSICGNPAIHLSVYSVLPLAIIRCIYYRVFFKSQYPPTKLTSTRPAPMTNFEEILGLEVSTGVSLFNSSGVVFCWMPGRKTWFS